MPQTADQIVVEVTALAGSYSQTMVQVADVTINNMKKAEDAAEKGSGTIGKALETIAGRVPDLIRNLGQGQNALHLFLQEGAQILPIFGPWGMVLGGALGAIDALAESMGAFEPEADRAKAATEAFSAAQDALKGVLNETSQAYIDAQAELSLLQQGYGALAQLSLNDAIEKNNAAIADSFVQIKEAGDWQTIEDALGLMAAFAQTNGNKVDQPFVDLQSAMAELATTTEPTLEQMNRFVQQLMEIRTRMPDSTDAVDGLLKAIVNMLPKLKEQADSQRALVQYQAAFSQSAGRAAEVLQVLGFGFIGATTEALKFGEAVEGAAGAMDALSKAKPTFAMAQGDISLSGSPSAPGFGVLGQTFGGQNPADLENSPFSDWPYGKGGPVTSKRGGGGERVRPESQLDKYLEQLRSEAAVLGLVGIALKENQLLTTALAKAKEDFRAKNKNATEEMVRAVKLTGEQTEQIKAQARLVVGVPDILKLAQENLPEFAATNQIQHLTEMRKLIADPAIAKALEAQGLSAADATRAIGYAMEKARESAYGTSEAIGAIGNAINSGIQGAASFAEALQKIGINLLNLLSQGAFGQGPLGKIFNSILGVGAGGLFGLLGGGSSAVTGATNAANAAVGLLGGKLAGGGQALPGQLYEIGETGREWFAPSVPGQVIPNHVIKAAAGGGGGAGGPPINFNISLAGANGDRTIAEIAAAAVKKGLAQVPEINRQHRIRFA
ncbi:MAG: hypothetical protein JF625_09900 [Inquilinus limosus]|uniref:Bacteriophage tail tape measure N-terminal domain-containing protein n=1 Tax=Inquilinus limosus TaxID=171674 RepID=A0A952KDN8_9PROT|nr:hypothetical protein [Inquilinus limosus]